MPMFWSSGHCVNEVTCIADEILPANNHFGKVPLERVEGKGNAPLWQLDAKYYGSRNLGRGELGMDMALKVIWKVVWPCMLVRKLECEKWSFRGHPFPPPSFPPFPFFSFNMPQTASMQP